LKEGLVAKAELWPGLTLIPELHHGQRRVFPFEAKTLGTVEYLPVRVAPPTGWETMAQDALRQRFRDLAEEAAEEAALKRGDRPPLGVERVLAQDPHSTPENVARSPRVRCFASTAQKREEYWQLYRQFVTELREGYDKLLAFWCRCGSEAICLPGFGFCGADAVP
jgi:hypothetical protein